MKHNSKIRPITAEDIADRHPLHLRASSDNDYAFVGNKILKNGSIVSVYGFGRGERDCVAVDALL